MNPSISCVSASQNFSDHSRRCTSVDDDLDDELDSRSDSSRYKTYDLGEEEGALDEISCGFQEHLIVR